MVTYSTAVVAALVAILVHFDLCTLYLGDFF